MTTFFLQSFKIVFFFLYLLIFWTFTINLLVLFPCRWQVFLVSEFCRTFDMCICWPYFTVFQLSVTFFLFRSFVEHSTQILWLLFFFWVLKLLIFFCIYEHSTSICWFYFHVGDDFIYFTVFRLAVMGFLVSEFCFKHLTWIYWFYFTTFQLSTGFYLQSFINNVNFCTHENFNFYKIVTNFFCIFFTGVSFVCFINIHSFTDIHFNSIQNSFSLFPFRWYLLKNYRLLYYVIVILFGILFWRHNKKVYNPLLC